MTTRSQASSRSQQKPDKPAKPPIEKAKRSQWNISEPSGKLLDFAVTCVRDAKSQSEAYVQQAIGLARLGRGDPDYSVGEVSNVITPVTITNQPLETDVDERIHIQEAMATVESIVANFMAGLFSYDSSFETDPYNTADKALATLVRDAINYFLSQQHRFCGYTFKEEIADILRRLGKYPVAIAKVGVETKYVEEVQYLFENGVRRKFTIPKVMVNPCIRAVDIANFGVANINRKTTQPPYQSFVYEYFNPTYAELLSREFVKTEIEIPYQTEGGGVEKKKVPIKYGVYRNLDNVRRYLSTSAQEQDRSTDPTSLAFSSEFPTIQAYEVWATNPIPTWIKLGDMTEADAKKLFKEWGIDEQDGMNPHKDIVVTYIQDSIPISIRMNWLDSGVRPYFAARFYPDDNNFYGGSVLSRLENHNQILDSLLFLGLENLKKLLNGLAALDKKFLKNKGDVQLAMRSGGIIELDTEEHPGDMERFLVPINIPNFSREAFDAIGLITGIAQRVTVPPSVQGATQSETATGARIDSSMGQQKLNLAFSEFVSCLYHPAIECVRDILRQFKDGDEMIKIFGEDGVEWRSISPQQWQTKVDIRVVGNLSFADKVTQAQMLINYANTLGQLLPKEVSLNIFRLILEINGFTKSRIDSVVPRGETETPPEQENLVLEKDTDVPVRLDDADMKHIPLHLEVKTEAAVRHILWHIRNMDYKRNQAEAMMQDPETARLKLQLTGQMAQSGLGQKAGSPPIQQNIDAAVQDMGQQQFQQSAEQGNNDSVAGVMAG